MISSIYIQQLMTSIKKFQVILAKDDKQSSKNTSYAGNQKNNFIVSMHVMKRNVFEAV